MVQPELRGNTNVRDLDDAQLARVHERLKRLHARVHAAIATPDREHVAEVVDTARWARLDVDTLLALKQYVPGLADAHWAQLKYSDRRTALALFAAFAAAPLGDDLIAMRNLRSRLDGLLNVARGLAATV